MSAPNSARRRASVGRSCAGNTASAPKVLRQPQRPAAARVRGINFRLQQRRRAAPPLHEYNDRGEVCITGAEKPGPPPAAWLRGAVPVILFAFVKRLAFFALGALLKRPDARPAAEKQAGENAEEADREARHVAAGYESACVEEKLCGSALVYLCKAAN